MNSTLQLQITPEQLQAQGALCSFCGQALNSKNTRIIRLTMDFQNGNIIQKYAAVCKDPQPNVEGHEPGDKSLLYTYIKIENEAGFQTITC